MMKKATKVMAGMSIAALLSLIVLFAPGLPWSARYRHTFNRVLTKAEMKIASWRGARPRLVSIKGRVVARRTDRQPLKGAEVEALDSKSGWATLTDGGGEFFLRDVTWYPRAEYTLIVIANEYLAKQLKVKAPPTYPDGGVFDVGELEFDRGCDVKVDRVPGRNSITYVEYDAQNAAYYRDLFDELTEGKATDEERVSAIKRHVSSRLICNGADETYEQPRQVLEKGSCYCGKLALAMATVLEAGNYKTRVLDLIGGEGGTTGHMVTEVYYGNGWHLYDPGPGAPSVNEQGAVASYEELRLNTGLIPAGTAAYYLPESPGRGGVPVANVYGSGTYHYYYFAR